MNTTLTDHVTKALTKVPAVTLGFWIIKILATTLGETGGDTVTMTWLGETTDDANPNGYLIGTAIFLPLLAILMFFQIKAKAFHPALYWATIVASTTAGTTMADFATRSLGIGYPGGSLLLFGSVIAILGCGTGRRDRYPSTRSPRRRSRRSTGRRSRCRKPWAQHWVIGSRDSGPGYDGAALVFGAALAVIAALHFWTARFAGTVVLGSVHPDATAWRNDRRLSGQAGRKRGPGSESARCLCDSRSDHRGFASLLFPQKAGRHPGQAA